MIWEKEIHMIHPAFDVKSTSITLTISLVAVRLQQYQQIGTSITY